MVQRMASSKRYLATRSCRWANYILMSEMAHLRHGSIIRAGSPRASFFCFCFYCCAVPHKLSSPHKLLQADDLLPLRAVTRKLGTPDSWLAGVIPLMAMIHGSDNAIDVATNSPCFAQATSGLTSRLGFWTLWTLACICNRTHEASDMHANALSSLAWYCTKLWTIVHDFVGLEDAWGNRFIQRAWRRQ